MRLMLSTLLLCGVVGTGSSTAQTADGASSIIRNGDNNTVETFNVTIGGNLALTENAEALELLKSIEQLVGGLVASGDLELSTSGAKNLSNGLVDIAENTVFPKFVILEDQFTIPIGITHILRDGQTTIGFRGYHQSGPMLFLNGEDTRPRTGGTVDFQFEGKNCRLVNNQVDRERDTATFTVIC